mmetsp:Transcript_30395/g.97198  ORF Transcript_30395/g.97198 Transcript_30395/m.97198 type:complete len:253 (+) Transcript_30395:276-1034(+)
MARRRWPGPRRRPLLPAGALRRRRAGLAGRAQRLRAAPLRGGVGVGGGGRRRGRAADSGVDAAARDHPDSPCLARGGRVRPACGPAPARPRVHGSRGGAPLLRLERRQVDGARGEAVPQAAPRRAQDGRGGPFPRGPAPRAPLPRGVARCRQAKGGRLPRRLARRSPCGAGCAARAERGWRGGAVAVGVGGRDARDDPPARWRRGGGGGARGGAARGRDGARARGGPRHARRQGCQARLLGRGARAAPRRRL